MKQLQLFKSTNTKKSILFTGMIFLFIWFISSIGINADSEYDGQHGKPLDTVFQEIREKQGLEPGEEINPRKVSNGDLEELGEVVMGSMVPDPEQHETMDNMMGGEGSRRLARMHRRMGYNYLRGRGYGMYGIGSMKRWRYNSRGMMM
jgi:hypothetical protein